MAVNKVVFGNTTVMDITDSTVTASKLKSGETAYAANGAKITGELVVPEVLDDLSDVVINTPANAHEIYYDGSQWINYGAKIFLTFDDDFKGQTITLTKGQTTITKTAPLSGNTMNLYVNETGTWTISSEISGNIYETEVNVTTFGTSFDAELNSAPPVPQGSVVTPTDDIQTWLHCANMWDKSYTTLAEVLTDRETFETLIADSNACDYMARSTTWAGNASVKVPTMTSATAPSGQTFSSGDYSGLPSWKAFDGDASTYSAVAGAGVTNGYIGYKFTSAVCINHLYFLDSANKRLITYRVEGSNTGNSDDWTPITEELSVPSSYEVDVTFSNTTSYQYYRIYQMSISIAGANITYNTIQFTYEGVTTSQDAMALIGRYDYCSNALLSNATWAEAIANSDYFEEVLNVKIPIMTSNTTPSGEVIYGQQVAGYEAYRAFDNNGVTWWAGTPRPTYVGYDFGTPVNVHKISIMPSSTSVSMGPDNAITSFKLQGSNTGNSDDWHDKSDVITVTDISRGVMTHYSVSDNTAYRYNRILEITNNGGTYDVVTELQFYGRASKEVLVPLVPTLTGYTGSNGEVIYSTEYNTSTYNAWHAFDGSDSTNWTSTSADSNIYIGYHFNSNVNIKQVRIKRSYQSTIQDRALTFKVSDDGLLWTEVGTGTLKSISGTPFQTYDLNNTYSKRYFAVFADAYLAGNGIMQIQFYEKTVQTNIVHSCANDTIYAYDDGSTVVLATTNSDGDGVLDFSSLEDKVYTLYSTVAKNPNDLTLQFARRIRITNSQYGGTTERYLLPDTIRTLYWYGREDSELQDVTTANGWTYTGSFVAPTHNTSYIALTGNSSSVSAIGTANAVSEQKNYRTIIQGVTAVNSIYGNLAKSSSKSFNNTTNVLQYKSSSVGTETYKSVPANEYPVIYVNKNMASKIYGVWYEDKIKTPTFISAVYDSLYIMDGNTKIWIANTDGEGKSLAPMLEAGTYTIYSSVAKDPNNLSNPYSKTVTVDESTQTIALMPDIDKTLYWWGYEGNELEDCTTANGWSSTMYTIVNPVHNSNNIYLNATSGTSFSAIAKSTAINNKTINAIGKQTAGTTVGWLIVLRSSKSLNDAAAVIGGSVPSLNTVSLVTVQPQSSDCYLQSGFGGGNRAGYLYALWYE